MEKNVRLRRLSAWWTVVADGVVAVEFYKILVQLKASLCAEWTPLVCGVQQRRMRRCEPGDHDRLARADHDPPCGAAHARLRTKKVTDSTNLNN
jgi:hypothetical protein